MYKKYCQLIIFIGLLAVATPLDDQSDISKNLTVLASPDTNPGSKLIFPIIGNQIFIIETSEAKNWYDAFATCYQMGARLIAFNTVEKWNAIIKYLDNANTLRYWTSGTDLIKQGKHIWFPTKDSISLNIWYPGEPNNYGGKEHCDELRYYRKSYAKLNDMECDAKRLFICEVPKRINN